MPCLFTVKLKSSKIDLVFHAWLDANFFKAQKYAGAIAKAFVYLNNQLKVNNDNYINSSQIRA